MISKLESAKGESVGIQRLLVEDPALVTFLVSISGNKVGRILWAHNSEHILGYSSTDELSLDTLVPTCFRERHTAMMQNLIYKRSEPKIFLDEYNMYIVNQRKMLMYGKWKIYLTNLKGTRELAILATFREGKSEQDFVVMSEDEQFQECTEGFAMFMMGSGFSRKSINSKDDLVWEGVFNHKKATVRRSTWDLMNCQTSILILWVSEEDANLIGDYSEYFRASDHEARQGVRFENPKLTKESERTDVGFCTDATNESTGPNRRFDSKIASMRSRERRCCFSIFLTLLAISSLSILTSLVILSVIQAVNRSFNSDIGDVNELGLRRFLAATAALRSKEMYTASSGFHAFCNVTAARIELQWISDTLKSMRMGLLDRSVSLQYQELMSLQVHPYWKFVEDGFQLHFFSVYDVMSEIAGSASLMATVPLAEVTDSFAPFRNLHRNGPTTALRVFNETLDEFIKAQGRAKHAEIHKLETVVLTTMAGLLVGSFAVLLPLFLRIELWRRTIWRVLFSLPTGPVSSTFENIALHLHEHHSIDVETEGITIKEVKSKPARIGPPPYSIAPRKKALLLCVIAHVCVSAGVQYVIYNQGVNRADDVLGHKPQVMNWGGLRRADSQLVRFYAREAWLFATGKGNVTNHEDDFDVFSRWLSSVSALNTHQRALAYDSKAIGSGTELLLSPTQRELLFGQNRSQGIVPLIAELEFATYEAQRKLLERGTEASYEDSIERTVSRLFPLLSESMSQYDAFSSELLATAEQSAILITVSFIASTVLNLAFCLVPLVLKVGDIQSSRDLRREIALFLYLPKDAVLKFILNL